MTPWEKMVALLALNTEGRRGRVGEKSPDSNEFQNWEGDEVLAEKSV